MWASHLSLIAFPEPVVDAAHHHHHHQGPQRVHHHAGPQRLHHHHGPHGLQRGYLLAPRGLWQGISGVYTGRGGIRPWHPPVLSPSAIILFLPQSNTVVQYVSLRPQNYPSKSASFLYPLPPWSCRQSYHLTAVYCYHPLNILIRVFVTKKVGFSVFLKLRPL